LHLVDRIHGGFCLWQGSIARLPYLLSPLWNVFDITGGQHGLPDGLDNVGNSQWLDFLHRFTTVKNLHLSEEVTLRVAPALQELVAESRTDVLPTLQNIFLEGCRPSGHVQEAIEQFVAARRHSGCPVAVHHCERQKSKW
jgi:hypothetical protein